MNPRPPAHTTNLYFDLVLNQRQIRRIYNFDSVFKFILDTVYLKNLKHYSHRSFLLKDFCTPW